MTYEKVTKRMKINTKTITRHAKSGITPSKQKLINPRLRFKSDILIENVLLAVCEKCDTVIAIPTQSESVVQSALDKMNDESKIAPSKV